MARGILQSRLRREPHGCIDGCAPVDRAHRRTAAHVAADQARLAAQQFGATLRHVLVRRAVESVLHYAFRPPLRGHAVLARVGGYAGVEFRFKGGYQGCARHAFAEGPDRGQIDGIVRRRSGQVLFQGPHYGIVDGERTAVLRAGMYRFESHCVHRNAGGANLLDGFPVVPHALQAPARQHLLRGHFQNLILQRSGSQIRNQQVHLMP
jgi:hypothetical protein